VGEEKRIYIEEGYEVKEVTTQLMDGVILRVIDGVEGALTVGQYELDFLYDESAKRLFERLNGGVSAGELLAFLAGESNIQKLLINAKVQYQRWLKERRQDGVTTDTHDVERYLSTYVYGDLVDLHRKHNATNEQIGKYVRLFNDFIETAMSEYE